MSGFRPGLEGGRNTRSVWVIPAPRGQRKQGYPKEEDMKLKLSIAPRCPDQTSNHFPDEDPGIRGLFGALMSVQAHSPEDMCTGGTQTLPTRSFSVQTFSTRSSQMQISHLRLSSMWTFLQGSLSMWFFPQSSYSVWTFPQAVSRRLFPHVPNRHICSSDVHRQE